jgi:hypothetical protein
MQKVRKCMHFMTWQSSAFCQVRHSCSGIALERLRPTAPLALRLIDEIATSTQHINRLVYRQQLLLLTKLALVAKAVLVLVLVVSIQR